MQSKVKVEVEVGSGRSTLKKEDPTKMVGEKNNGKEGKPSVKIIVFK